MTEVAVGDRAILRCGISHNGQTRRISGGLNILVVTSVMTEEQSVAVKLADNPSSDEFKIPWWKLEFL